MKVSVIIPAYNEEKSLGQTLDAVMVSDYHDFEIIVSDNGSVDKTSEIARSKGVKVVSEKRKGTLWAREAGRKAATGEILVFLDADCLPEKTWLSNILKIQKLWPLVELTIIMMVQFFLDGCLSIRRNTSIRPSMLL